MKTTIKTAKAAYIAVSIRIERVDTTMVSVAGVSIPSMASLIAVDNHMLISANTNPPTSITGIVDASITG